MNSSNNISYNRENLVKSVIKAIVPNDIITNVTKRIKKPVFNDSEIQLLSDGVFLRNPARVSYGDLRRASYTTSLIGAIHKIRVDDLIRFSNISFSHRKEGFGFIMDDEEASPSDEDKVLIKQATKFFEFMGEKVEGWSSRDRLHTVFEMMIRDILSIDKNAFFLVKNQLGRLIEIKYLDPATIFHVDPTKGYRGDKKVRYVQIVNNNIKEVFTADEIILRHQYHLSDVMMRGDGFSPCEASIMELVAVMNLLKYNRDRFTSRNPPPGMITLEGEVSDEVLESIQEQYANLYAGNNNNFRIPVIAAPGKVNYMSISGIPDDMTFDKLYQTVSSLVLASHGMDSAELGIRLQDSQSLSEASQDGKMNNALTRAKKAMLSYFTSCFNELKDHIPEFDVVKQTFFVNDPSQANDEFEKNEKSLRTFMTIDEIRARNDLPTLGEWFSKTYEVDLEKVKRLGGTILDGTFSMYSQNILMALDGGGMPEMGSGGEDPNMDGDDTQEGGEEDAPQEEEDE